MDVGEILVGFKVKDMRFDTPYRAVLTSPLAPKHKGQGGSVD